MKRGRRRMVLMIVMVLVGMVFVLPAAPAFAVTCSGSGCEGKNPQTTGCSTDAITAYSTAIPNGKVELRWSQTCETFWSRVTSWIGPTTIRTRVQRQSGSPSTYDDIDYGATQAYNDKMMYDLFLGPRHRACGRLGSDTTWHCTIWY
jgi:hypothetical protein